MGQDYYAEALDIAECLKRGGLSAEAQVLRDAIDGGSTGTEILLALRWHLKRIDELDPDISFETKSRIRKLSTALDAVLGV